MCCGRLWSTNKRITNIMWEMPWGLKSQPSRLAWPELLGDHHPATAIAPRSRGFDLISWPRRTFGSHGATTPTWPKTKLSGNDDNVTRQAGTPNRMYLWFVCYELLQTWLTFIGNVMRWSIAVIAVELEYLSVCRRLSAKQAVYGRWDHSHSISLSLGLCTLFVRCAMMDNSSTHAIPNWNPGMVDSISLYRNAADNFHRSSLPLHLTRNSAWHFMWAMTKKRNTDSADTEDK